MSPSAHDSLQPYESGGKVEDPRHDLGGIPTVMPHFDPRLMDELQ